ncbi:MAG: RNA 2',3'-cyclic phosphodiesterase [Dehalococcoidales bacterium]|nr:RNA 2',3'-cyclic phosphodiesterase [Dehalococcoidales bacterium]
MEQIRSFIAIELPGDLKLQLEHLEEQLKASKQPWVKWVSPGSIHLTLKFLDSVPVDKTGEITGAIAEAVRGITPFQLKFEGLGVFPNLRMAQVAWVGVSGEAEKLKRLQGQIDTSLSRLGFTPESRPFTPHLTIARIRSQASPDERIRFGQLIADTKFTACSIGVDGISLMKSQLSREGAIYSRISLTKLAK